MAIWLSHTALVFVAEGLELNFWSSQIESRIATLPLFLQQFQKGKIAQAHCCGMVIPPTHHCVIWLLPTRLSKGLV